MSQFPSSENNGDNINSNSFLLRLLWASLVVQTVKASARNAGDLGVRSLGQEEPLEKGVATHFSTLAWKISWMEESGGLQSMGPQRVGHD